MMKMGLLGNIKKAMSGANTFNAAPDDAFNFLKNESEQLINNPQIKSSGIRTKVAAIGIGSRLIAGGVKIIDTDPAKKTVTYQYRVNLLGMTSNLVVQIDPLNDGKASIISMSRPFVPGGNYQISINVETAIIGALEDKFGRLDQ